MPNYKSNCKVIGNSITVTVIDPALLKYKTVSSQSSQNGQLSRSDNAKPHELWLPESLWKGDTTDPTQEIIKT